MTLKQCKHASCGEVCKYQAKPKEKYRIRQFSLKRQEENKLYFKEAKEFIKNNPVCMIKSPVCRGKSEHPHHPKGRGKNLRNWDIMIPACDPCNDYCEQHPQWAREHGFIQSKLAV